MRPALHGQRVLVHGLGKSGLAAIRLLLREGARVSAVEAKGEQELGALAGELRAQGVTLHLGAPPAGLHESAELIVVSPGVPLALPELQRALSKGVPVWGEVELASRFFAAAPVVGITGTNGKSTTTALAGELLARSGKRAFVGGNLGRAASEAPLEGPFEAYVIELSSFQLEGIQKMRVHAAAILNLTPDHLDRYPSHEEYGKAKARIFMNQAAGDVAVVNADDEHVVRLARTARVPVLGFSVRRGAPLPAWFAGGARPAEEGPSRAGFEITLPDRPLARFTLTARTLRGQHNLANAMAASLLALNAGGTPAGVQQGLDSYPGLAHRLESVRTLDGVEYVNDSKATNVDSTLVALAAFEHGIWLIAGGKGKGAPYEPLVQASAGKLRGVLTIGKDAPAIEAAFRGHAEVIGCGTLAGAVERARALAQPGEVVLLSPACASYDQFRNFEDRGEQFKALVGWLK